MTRLPLTILACLLGSTLPISASSAAGTLTIDDYGSLSSVGTPQLSTDGKQVVYTLDDRLYLVAIAGGEPRAITLTTSSAWSPQWSEDGSALYFLSDRSGSSQLWKLPVDTFGEAQQVTDLPRGVSTLNMSPDETRLLLSYDDEQPTPEDDDEPGPWVMDRLQFKEDAGDGYLTARPSDHLYVYDLAGKALRQVTSGRFTEDEAAWSEDGNSVVFVSNRETEPDASYKNDLWVVDAAGNEAAPRRVTNDDSVKSSPAFSPDGKQIAYLDAVDGVYGIYRLMVVPATGGVATDLTAGLDRWVTSFRYADDGRSIVFLYENRGARQLARVNLASGKIDTILGGERFVSGFDLDRRNRGVVRLATGNGAADLYRLDSGNPRQLTAVNAEFFATHTLGKREKVTYRVADGTEVDAFVTLPPDFDPARRYPAVLHIHGGPVGQFSWGFDFRAEFLAANGYVVLQPNPRGSNGRGQDFVRAIYRTWGITDYPDLIGAIDHAIELGYADPERLAVTGYSYGGYMTNVVITRSQRFDAAASGAGHSLIAANYGHDIYQKWYNWELGPPATNREKYDVLSPFLDVDKATTPTIFLGGREDWNVPVLNAELMYQSLRQQGVPARLVVYPDTHHGGWSERYDKDYLERVVAWFDQHVK